MIAGDNDLVTMRQLTQPVVYVLQHRKGVRERLVEDRKVAGMDQDVAVGGARECRSGKPAAEREAPFFGIRCGSFWTVRQSASCF